MRTNWNYKVLVVDDEPDICSIYQDMLTANVGKQQLKSSRSSSTTPAVRAEGEFLFEIETANTAEEALEKVRALKEKGEAFAMGFFDVRLGQGMDGVELVSEIQKLDPRIYTVFVTAYNDRTIDSISATLGTSRVDQWDYVMKPFSANEIIQKARNFVSLWNLNRESERHNDQMSELNRRVLESERVTSVAAVARGVAHEFGNLLMQIMGKAEVSRNKDSEDMKAALEKIIDASQRAHEILDRFNHLSDTKTKTTIKTKQVVGDVVNDAIDLLSHQFKKQGIKVNRLKVDPVVARLHSTSVLQVLVNLFINAMHAMEGSGQIDISVNDIGTDFEIVVRDYGPGVPEELKDKILEPFFTTKGEKGTGLGLAISKEIIEIDHGGEFLLENHKEKGLQITLRLPKNVESEVERRVS